MNDLKRIKKLYGEKMSQLCRDLFPEILDNQGVLSEILEKNFNPDRQLGLDIIENDIEGFKAYVYNLIDIDEKDLVLTNKTPEELLNEVDYDLYKCETVEDLNKFRSYYKPDELICTFKDGGDGSGRLNKNHIFFAVHKNVDQIKRAEKPRREDDYGVSVMSIQISKDRNWLSIKNRYNHTVNSPDATFSNNLDNIIPGLTCAFNLEYDLEIGKSTRIKLDLPRYIKAIDGKIYRYNKEKNNIYYCPDNIIIDNGEVKKFDKSKTRIIDKFIINKEGDPPSITKIDKEDEDSFTDTIFEIKQIIEEKKKTEEGEEFLEITLIPQDENKSIANINVDKSNNIIGYKNNNVEVIEDYFLHDNECLKEIEMSKLKQIGEHFLYSNKELKEIELPQIEQIRNCFLFDNKRLKKANFQNLKQVGLAFLYGNRELNEIKLPQIEQVGDSFLVNNKKLKKIDFQNLKQVGKNFMYNNTELKEIELPQIEQLGKGFLYNNENFKQVENSFLRNDENIEKSEKLNLRQILKRFIVNNVKSSSKVKKETNKERDGEDR